MKTLLTATFNMNKKICILIGEVNSLAAFSTDLLLIRTYFAHCEVGIFHCFVSTFHTKQKNSQVSSM